MNLYSVAALYIGLNILLKLGLAFRVIFIRRNQSIGLGDGGDKTMQRAIRAHANATEYMPLAMIGLIALTGVGYPIWVIHGLGILFTFGRGLHAYGLSGNSGVSFGRFYGTICSTFSMALMALLCIFAIFG